MENGINLTKGESWQKSAPGASTSALLFEDVNVTEHARLQCVRNHILGHVSSTVSGLEFLQGVMHESETLLSRNSVNVSSDSADAFALKLVNVTCEQASFTIAANRTACGVFHK